jgi:hypothetical protein
VLEKLIFKLFYSISCISSDKQVLATFLQLLKCFNILFTSDGSFLTARWHLISRKLILARSQRGLISSLFLGRMPSFYFLFTLSLSFIFGICLRPAIIDSNFSAVWLTLSFWSCPLLFDFHPFFTPWLPSYVAWSVLLLMKESILYCAYFAVFALHKPLFINRLLLFNLCLSFTYLSSSKSFLGSILFCFTAASLCQHLLFDVKLLFDSCFSSLIALFFLLLKRPDFRFDFQAYWFDPTPSVYFISSLKFYLFLFEFQPVPGWPLPILFSWTFTTCDETSSNPSWSFSLSLSLSLSPTHVQFLFFLSIWGKDCFV